MMVGHKGGERMEKPATCEWQDCKDKPLISVILDGEKYWFCGHNHADEFREWITSSGNY
jgi:hypothetical protein